MNAAKGHIKPECPILKNKQRSYDNATQDRRKDRQRRAYIAWEDSDSGCSSSDDDEQSLEEETNLCLMAGSVKLGTSGNNFDDEPIEDRYYQLLYAFQELHVEAMRL